MSDKELEEYINKIEPNFDSHLEKGTIEMSNEYYNLLEEKMVRLINKNQELKSQLKGTTHCFDEEEHEKLKKQLEELKEEKRKVRDYINKHCVNEKISKEVGYKCYTMADTNELEKIMKILGDKE